MCLNSDAARPIKEKKRVIGVGCPEARDMRLRQWTYPGFVER